MSNPVSAFFAIIHNEKKLQLVIDLEPYLYKIDNYDILTDILHGNQKEVSEYSKPKLKK